MLISPESHTLHSLALLLNRVFAHINGNDPSLSRGSEAIALPIDYLDNEYLALRIFSSSGSSRAGITCLDLEIS